MSSQKAPCNAPALTSLHIRQKKGQEKIVMLTAYDYPSALFAEAGGVDMVLVGDSLGMVVLGDQDTLAVTMDAMVHHCRAVSKAVHSALVVCDMPFLSYEKDVSTALDNAGRLLSQGGARAVKLEGAFTILPQIQALIAAGIPVMGHIGLTPQRVATLGGYKVQGNTVRAAEQLLQEAKALESAGCFSLVLECVPFEVAAHITQSIDIPTIGIGAGAHCDGQVLVYHDMLGLNTGHVPKFVKKYAQIGHDITQAITQYSQDVRAGTFPQAEQSFSLTAEEHTLFQQHTRSATDHTTKS